MRKETLRKFLALFLLLVFPFQVLAQIEPGFDPNKLIDDKVFSDTQTFGGPEGVQKFLEVKNSVLADTSSNFLVKLKEPDNVLLKTGLEDPRPSLGRLRTAAELIWDASKHSGLNPQVILVTLNKEQGLITSASDYSPERLQKALDRAMGFDCPDASGCGNLFPGFYYQLFGNYDADGNRYLGASKSLMKSFTTPGGRGPLIDGRTSRVGESITLENTLGGYAEATPSQVVTIFNQATAALYRYTPHVFNGNYNFWKFFNAWFRYPNGTLLSLANDVKTYIIQNGTKQLVPEFVAKQRGLDLTQKIAISPNEFESYPLDKIYAPADNTVVKSLADGKMYVFTSGTKHPASAFVIGQRGLDASKALDISSEEAALFESGSVLPPADGTIIRGVLGTAVYLVDSGKIKLFSEFTFKQRKITPKQIVTVPDEEIPTYTQQGFVAPQDGTLVKAKESATVYLIETGFKRPLTGELFKNRALSFKNVVALSSDEVGALPLGAFATPKNQTFFSVENKSGALYIFKEGTKHSISSFVAKQRGITPDYTFTKSMANEWYDGIPIPPRDGTLVKASSSSTVYLVSKGQLRPLSAKAFKSRGYKASKINTLPKDEVEAYAKGDPILK